MLQLVLADTCMFKCHFCDVNQSSVHRVKLEDFSTVFINLIKFKLCMIVLCVGKLTHNAFGDFGILIIINGESDAFWHLKMLYIEFMSWMPFSKIFQTLYYDEHFELYTFLPCVVKLSLIFKG